VKKKREQTAAEFLAERNAVPEWVAAQRAREEAHALRVAAAKVALEPALLSIRSAGFPIESIDDLVRVYAPLPKRLVAILLETLPTLEDPSLQEAIVRPLGASYIEYDGRALTELFETTHNESLRWAIANTLSIGKMRNVGQWILDTVQKKEYGTARQMLPLAAVRHNPPELANPILVKLISDLPGHVALALAESGGKAEMEALQGQYEKVDGWVKKAIGQAIGVIQRRLQERREE
jgi:hypothetical protein